MALRASRRQASSLDPAQRIGDRPLARDPQPNASGSLRKYPSRSLLRLDHFHESSVVVEGPILAWDWRPLLAEREMLLSLGGLHRRFYAVPCPDPPRRYCAAENDEMISVGHQFLDIAEENDGTIGVEHHTVETRTLICGCS